MNPFLTVFIPAYNEEENLCHCVDVVLGKMDEWGVPVEILIVDDGSQDNTGEVCDDLARRIPRLRAIHHLKNRGIGGAFLTAREQAQGEWFILIPADLALYPGELCRYLEAAPQGDIIVGLRSDRSDYTFLRKLVSWTNICLIQVLFGMKERQFQYISMYRTKTLRQIEIEYWQSAFFLAEILIKAKAQGFRLVEVEIRYAPRLTGKPTGAKAWLVLKTVRDIGSFWIRLQLDKITARQSGKVKVRPG